jgi:uncharacterized phage infection (PIP) family protein YhgE
MSDQSLSVLERDVEVARNKMAADLAILRSPQAYSEFTADLKTDAWTSVQSSIESFVDDIKARAATNPVAVLAIGAGIAWRMVRHPPVATALIGAGLYSLFTTSPSGPRPRTNEGYLSQAKDRLREQASDLASDVKDKALALGEAATDKASELASKMTEGVTDVYRAAADGVTQSASTATDQAEQWTEEARASIKELANDVQDSVSRNQARSASSPLRETWSPSLQPDQASRDTLLLGVAGAAVAAALGIALQRRNREPDEAHGPHRWPERNREF